MFTVVIYYNNLYQLNKIPKSLINKFHLPTDCTRCLPFRRSHLCRPISQSWRCFHRSSRSRGSSCGYSYQLAVLSSQLQWHRSSICRCSSCCTCSCSTILCISLHSIPSLLSLLVCFTLHHVRVIHTVLTFCLCYIRLMFYFVFKLLNVCLIYEYNIFLQS